MFPPAVCESLKPTNTYLIFNMTASIVYFMIFLVTLHRVLGHTKDFRNRTTLFIMCITPLFSTLFLMNTVNELFLFQQDLELLLFLFAFTPVMLIFLLRKYIFENENPAKVAVERFDKLKDEFLTVASHELRTPLSVINGFAEILVREKLGTLNEEQKRRVRKILMQAQRLNHIIDNLLDLSRIRAGKITVKRDVFDLVPVLKSCLDDHRIVCDQQSIELCDEIADVLPDVLGDLERTNQIVINLLSNAIKYTHPGGKITLKAFHDMGKHEVRIEIQDTGIGISPEEQNLVFKEFYRASDQHARKYAGSGLGLTIAKQLVETQGGHVGVNSEGVGKGSTFFFTMMMAEAESPE